MSRALKFGRIGLLVIGIGNALLDVANQRNEMRGNPNQKFDWSRLAAAFVKGASIGAVAGTTIGGLFDFKNSFLPKKNTDGYLTRLSNRVRLDKGSVTFKTVDSKAELLKNILGSRFSRKLLAPPERLGSTEKGTALQDNFDIDLGLNFRASSFSSSAKMRFSVLKFLKTKVGKYGITAVREQRASIGVIFDVEGHRFKIDVVPVKLTEGNESSGYLSVMRPTFLYNKYSHQKTSISVLKKFKLSATQKRIVLVLKHWKEKNKIPLPSYLLENLVLDAYEYTRRIPNGFTGKLIMVLNHIAKNLDVAVIRSIENSNNILTNIESSKKSEIIEACENVVTEYRYQPNSIMQIF